MIKDKEKFICPVHREGLQWPQARCPKCGVDYYFRSISDSVLAKDRQLSIYDFRQKDEDTDRDRRQLPAHLKMIEGLSLFEEDFLKEMQFDYEIHKIAFNRTPKRKIMLRYFIATFFNYFNLFNGIVDKF